MTYKARNLTGTGRWRRLNYEKNTMNLLYVFIFILVILGTREFVTTFSCYWYLEFSLFLLVSDISYILFYLWISLFDFLSFLYHFIQNFTFNWDDSLSYYWLIFSNTFHFALILSPSQFLSKAENPIMLLIFD